MPFARLRRVILACPLPLVLVSFLPFPIAASADQLPAQGPAASPTNGSSGDSAGIVVDQTSRPLPRACVRTLDSSATGTTGVFADERGRFRVPIPASGDCRVEASLTGFDTSIVPYTFLDSEILQSTSPGSVVFRHGQWLFRRPRHSGFVELTWAVQRFTIDL